MSCAEIRGCAGGKKAIPPPKIGTSLLKTPARRGRYQGGFGANRAHLCAKYPALSGEHVFFSPRDATPETRKILPLARNLGGYSAGRETGEGRKRGLLGSGGSLAARNVRHFPARSPRGGNFPAAGTVRLRQPASYRPRLRQRGFFRGKEGGLPVGTGGGLSRGAGRREPRIGSPLPFSPAACGKRTMRKRFQKNVFALSKTAKQVLRMQVFRGAFPRVPVPYSAPGAPGGIPKKRPPGGRFLLPFHPSGRTKPAGSAVARSHPTTRSRNTRRLMYTTPSYPTSDVTVYV